MVAACDGRGWGTRTFWAGGDVLYLEGFEQQVYTVVKTQQKYT